MKVLLDAGADPYVDEQGTVGSSKAPANLSPRPTVEAVLNVRLLLCAIEALKPMLMPFIKNSFLHGMGDVKPMLMPFNKPLFLHGVGDVKPMLMPPH